MLHCGLHALNTLLLQAGCDSVSACHLNDVTKHLYDKEKEICSDTSDTKPDDRGNYPVETLLFVLRQANLQYKFLRVGKSINIEFFFFQNKKILRIISGFYGDCWLSSWHRRPLRVHCKIQKGILACRRQRHAHVGHKKTISVVVLRAAVPETHCGCNSSLSTDRSKADRTSAQETKRRSV